ncbi:ORF10 [Betabaculovirus altermyunipunctae]|uniref:ORF10 n=1 Tax=Betabaculovirus altermyunipunctae TaxID=3051996 RepID=A0A1S5YE29_9BBAC|nr:ORF10 [Betabaculovirus altermyunipunctae]AQQ80420.1 ORF10 [Betabaculovirus altermyunipunctae]
MLSLGKANASDVDSLTFQIAFGYDACLQFKYAITAPPKQPKWSKAVSGIDSTQPLAFNLCPAAMCKIKNSYVISVFRLPYLYPQLVKEAPMTVAKVFTRHDAPEIWYVLGVRKNFESPKTAQTKGVLTAQGTYEKELFSLSGNLPREFVAALKSTRVRNVHSLHSLTTNTPLVLVNNTPVQLLQRVHTERRLN